MDVGRVFFSLGLNSERLSFNTALPLVSMKLKA